MLRRYTPAPSAGDRDASGSFTLAPAERALVGVSTVGADVVLRASGLQWGASGLSAAGWTGVTLASVGLDAPWAVSLGFALFAVTSFVALGLLRRQVVRLRPDGLEVRPRVGASRSFDWTNAEFAVEVRENGGVWLRGVERATTAVGVVRAAMPRGHWIDLPGVRSPMWGANKVDDPLTSTEVKVRLVLRYRHQLGVLDATDG